LLCVDAAYHLHPRSAFLQGAWRLLRPGGTLAFTDLVVAEAASLPARAVLSACARACGLAPGGLHGEAGLQQQLQDAGFEDVTLRRLDDAVLGGFARFVRAQGPRLGRAAHSAAWRRPVWTARAIGPCRAAGLGYALLVARKPSGTRLDSSTAAATA
jgi:erythromycin 3''-O-methyltransferase